MMMDEVDVEQAKLLPNYLLDAAGISIERMPMLNVIFDRMAASCTDSLLGLGCRRLPPVLFFKPLSFRGGVGGGYPRIPRSWRTRHAPTPTPPLKGRG